jgi:ParB family chromosome partitioning protein
VSAVEKSVTETREEYGSIPVDQISVAVNIRRTFDQGKLQELAASLKEYGVLQPLVVRPLDGKYGRIYELVVGERRLRAARIAGLAQVPCRIVQLDAKQVAEIQLLENLQREDLNPLEEARALSDLMWEHGYTQEALARKLGKSQPWVASRTRLLDLPEAVRDGITRGIVSSSAAEAMMPFAKASGVLAEVVRHMEEEPIPVAHVKETVEDEVRSSGKPVYKQGYYGHDEPQFDVGPCQNCEHVVRVRPGYYETEPKPYCLNVECWEKKQKAAEEAILADAGQADVVDTSKLDYRAYHCFYSSGAPAECAGCADLKKGRHGASGNVYDVCLKPKCLAKRQREAEKAKKKAEGEERTAAVTELLRQCKDKGFVDDLALTSRRLLVFLAGLIFLHVDAPYEFPVKDWRKENLDWPVTYGDYSAGGGEWPKVAKALHVIDSTTLAALVFEWVISVGVAGGRPEPVRYLVGQLDAEVPETEVATTPGNIGESEGPGDPEDDGEGEPK